MSLFELNIEPGNARSADDGATSNVGTVTATPARLADLQPDERNANAGTERGRSMLESSLRKYGAGRSLLADRYGRIIAGNHVAEVAADIGLDDCIVVPTDGRKLVVVQRTDLDLDSPAARALAIADNRTSEVGLSWDTTRLAELAADDAIRPVGAVLTRRTRGPARRGCACAPLPAGDARTSAR